MTEAKPKPMRVDARRNRERVLRVARKLFEEKGASVEMDEVARQSGVGVGTVYRHFPTKEALMQSVLADHIQHLVDGAQHFIDAPDAGRAFFDFLSLLAEELLVKGNLHVSLARAGLAVPERTAERDAFEKVLHRLLARAQKSGAVRRDITAPEVVLLARGALFPSDAENIPIALRRRMFSVVCQGLRTKPRA